MATKRERPYWLRGGTETCEVCLQPVALHTERRCAACDRAVCGQCVVVDADSGEALCDECRAEERGGH
jgi:hypothetical protein